MRAGTSSDVTFAIASWPRPATESEALQITESDSHYLTYSTACVCFDAHRTRYIKDIYEIILIVYPKKSILRFIQF